MTQLDLTRQDIRDIQARLSVLGFDPNGIDGAAGRGTRAAISAWQVSRGIPQTGYLDANQLGALRLQSNGALESWLQDPGNRTRYEPPPPVPITTALVNGRWRYTSTCGRNSRMPGRTIRGEMQIVYSGGSRFSGALANTQGLRGTLSGTLRGRQLNGTVRWGLLLGSTTFQAAISDDGRSASGRDSLGCSFRARRP